MARRTWYSPTTWVEKITHVGPTNLNKAETGIANAHSRIDALTFNVIDYGATGDGSADDTTFIQAAITACIAAGGGVVYLPAGTYKITGTLDFSAMSGTYKAVTFKGAGSGAHNSAVSGATKITSTFAGTALKAQGVNSGNYISGLYLEGFTLVVPDLGAATTYAIYWDGVVGHAGMRDLWVEGSGSGLAACGSGIAILNPFNGQVKISNIVVRNFTGTGSNGYRISAAATTNYPSGLNSGNLVASAALAWNCTTGWKINETGANVLDGVVLNACKAVGAPSTSPGFHIQAADSVVLNGCHSEGHKIGFKLETSRSCTLNSPFVTNGTNPGGVGSVAIQFVSTSKGHKVIAASLWDMETGVSFDSTSDGNEVQALSNATFPVTTMFSDSSTSGKNVTWDVSGFPKVPVPRARVFSTTNLTLTTAVEAAATFDSERYDTDTIHDVGANTSRLTAKTAGTYRIFGNATFAANSTGIRQVRFRINGSTFIVTDGRPAVAAGSGSTNIPVATEYALAVNDYVEMLCYQDSGGNLVVSSHEFGMSRVG